MTRQVDIAVVGGGAAGLTAAIFATEAAPGADVVVLDGAPRIGAKILISGGGRCNVTHHAVTAADFNGSRNAIAKVLRSFPVERTVDWFRSIGVPLVREETGKLFPVTGRARSVLDALLDAARGAEILTRHRVTSVTSTPGGYDVEVEGQSALRAARVILAAGGRSVPKTGSDGSGYSIATALGHSVASPFPALVPLLLDPSHPLVQLSGTSADVELALRSAEGRVLMRHRGSMLCTHFGLSGPVVLDISRHWIAARREGTPATLTCSFLPGEDFARLEAALIEAGRSNPRSTIASILRGRLPERLVTAIAGAASLDAATPLGAMTKEGRRALIRCLTEMPLPVTRDRGFDYAEVTAGGVPLAEVATATMESRRSAGLYLCGEILDVDGRIGGFNFQWAWSSGRLAGRSAAVSLV